MELIDVYDRLYNERFAYCTSQQIQSERDAGYFRLLNDVFHKLNPRQVDIIQKLAQGVSVNDLATAHNISVSRVRQIRDQSRRHLLYWTRLHLSIHLQDRYISSSNSKVQRQ